MTEVGEMGMHSRRVRCCGDCLSGDHDLENDSWWTDFLRLLRRKCMCVDCDCTFLKVLVEYPRFDQRHHQPGVVGRRRRTAKRHAA